MNWTYTNIYFFKNISVFHFNWGYATSTGRPSKKTEQIKVKIEYLKSTKVVYFRRVGIYGTENKLLMRAFKKWVKTENLFQKSTILGIALDNPQSTPAKDCRYDVCLITDKKRFKDNVEQRTLGGGTYAVFKVAHIEKVIIDFYMNIAQTIAKNQLNVLSKPIIERYKQNLVDKGYCEILIPIEQK